MTRRIVFHVGMPKCGTSTIQKGLGKYRSYLEEHSITYPHIEQFNEFFSNKRRISTGNANAIVYGMLVEHGDRSWGKHIKPENIYDTVVEIIANSNCQTAIFSHEDFISLPTEWLVELINRLGYTINQATIIFYIRDHFSWLASDYQQQIKQLRITASIEEQVKKRIPFCQFHSYCNNFTKYFKPQNLKLKLLNKKTISGNLLYDFTLLLGQPIEAFKEIKLENVNESVDFLSLQILRAANKKNISDDDYRILLNNSFKLYNSNKLEKFSLPTHVIDSIRDVCCDDAEKLRPFMSDLDWNILLKTLNNRSVEKESSSILPENVCLNIVDHIFGMVDELRT